MLNENLLLIGQVLQIRDKLIAKRHCVPTSLKDEWDSLVAKTDCFDSAAMLSHAIKGKTDAKPATFRGSAKELMSLVSALKELNVKVNSHH